MIEKFIKPKFKKIVSEKLNNRTYTKRFQLEKLDRGFANTIGTSLRRVLLSSIPGAAVFAVEIKGVSHEFSAIDHVREDVVGVILNIKNLILSIEEKAIEEDDVFELKLKSKSGVVKAKDIQTPSEIKIVNGDLELANTTKDNALDMTLYVAYSKGFKSFEENRALVKDKLGEKRGIITIDSNFSPVEKVNLKVEEVNPGESRVFERLIMDVTTKGNVEVEKVMAFAGKVLETIFATFGELEVVDIDKNFTDEEEIVEEDVQLKVLIDTLNLSVRSENALKKAGVLNVEDLVNNTVSDLKKIDNLGETSIKEIIEVVKDLGLAFKSE